MPPILPTEASQASAPLTALVGRRADDRGARTPDAAGAPFEVAFATARSASDRTAAPARRAPSRTTGGLRTADDRHRGAEPARVRPASRSTRDVGSMRDDARTDDRRDRTETGRPGSLAAPAVHARGPSPASERGDAVRQEAAAPGAPQPDPAASPEADGTPAVNAAHPGDATAEAAGATIATGDELALASDPDITAAAPPPSDSDDPVGATATASASEAPTVLEGAPEGSATIDSETAAAAPMAPDVSTADEARARDAETVTDTLSIPVAREAEARLRPGDGLPPAARRAVDRWLAATRAADGDGKAETTAAADGRVVVPGATPEAPHAVESVESGALDGAGHQPVPLAGVPGRTGAAGATIAPTAFEEALAASTADGLAPQLVRALHVQLRQGVSEARVQLRPEHLGAVTIELRVEHGQVTATIRAETPQVAQWIESNQQALRQALADQGLSLGRFAVNPDGTAPDGERREPGSTPRRRPVPPGRDTPPRFEVVV